MGTPTEELIEEYKGIVRERDAEVTRVQDVASKLSGENMLLMSSLQKMTAEARLTLTESGGCDHSVGICQCGLERDVIEAELLVGTLIVCPDCDSGGREDGRQCGTCGDQGVIKKEVEDNG